MLSATPATTIQRIRNALGMGGRAGFARGDLWRALGVLAVITVAFFCATEVAQTLATLVPADAPTWAHALDILMALALAWATLGFAALRVAKFFLDLQALRPANRSQRPRERAHHMYSALLRGRFIPPRGFSLFF